MTLGCEVDVWLVRLDEEGEWLPPLAAEWERAERLRQLDGRRRYLRSHAALRSVLGRYTEVPLELIAGEHGKPYLSSSPELMFNLSHSAERALIAVARDIEVGVDIERLRPLQQYLSIAERFFPPAAFQALTELPDEGRESAFFRSWTFIEAKLKARGIGLYGAGTELDGEWSVAPVEVDPGYVGAVAVNRSGVQVRVHRFQPKV